MVWAKHSLSVELDPYGPDLHQEYGNLILAAIEAPTVRILGETFSARRYWLIS